MLLFLLARLRGERVHLRDGFPQHLLVLRLAGPERSNLLVQIVALLDVLVAVALHQGGQLVHEVLELAPLQRHRVVEEAAVHTLGGPALLPLAVGGRLLRHGHGGRRLAARGADQAPLLKQARRRHGARGSPGPQGVQQRALGAGRPLQLGHDLWVARVQRDALRGVAHLPLDQSVAVVLAARGTPGHVQDGVEHGLVVLPEA
mmetsp:Transcript_48509/g.135234  ORF Transcript_48509/g.135234 Transcript_48509/m.135234 type:complete len:203 (+) Transcript_48509:1556-2164(+)